MKAPQLGDRDEATHVEDFAIDPHFASIAETFAFYNSFPAAILFSSSRDREAKQQHPGR
jgi:hypothetical protein